MKLDAISFIGIDEHTDFEKLEELANNSPIQLEYGVLYSPSRAGKQKRYPTLDWIEKFLRWHNSVPKSKDARKFDISLHLCGSSVSDYLEEKANKINVLSDLFDRVQLNFAAKDYDLNYLVENILKLADEKDHVLIIQHNKSKEKLIKELIRQNTLFSAIDFLFDGSGGFGRVLEQPLEPIADYYCGYAGGIGPETVKDIVNKIYELKADAPLLHRYGIQNSRE